ncbi:hypothetical protein F4778DRAFT_779369 [Xylariomycetidae sp. FL2044]|nr:hypothetical protein F4778DRAFT_779369 [Xylariomycetidae sp. FL2044]
MSSPCFPKFNRLPLELQIEIWKLAAPVEEGVHHFNMKMAEKEGFDINIQKGTPLSILPMSSKQDGSLWRTRNALSRTCQIARGVVGPYKGIKIYDNSTAQRMKLRTNEVAKVRSSDLVVFGFTGPWQVLSFKFFRLPKPEMFTGLTRVAFEYNPSIQKPWAMRPNYCHVIHHHQVDSCHCETVICEFIDYFRHLQSFHFILKITSKQLVAPKKLTHKEKVAKCQGRLAEYRVKKAMNEFRRNAFDKDLKIYQDTNGGYYEVQEEDASNLIEQRWLWPLVQAVEKRWKEQEKKRALADERRRRKLKFRVLVTAKPQFSGTYEE